MYVSPATLYLHLRLCLDCSQRNICFDVRMSKPTTIRSSWTKICKWHNVRNQETQVRRYTKVNVFYCECRMHEKIFSTLKYYLRIRVKRKMKVPDKAATTRNKVDGHNKYSTKEHTAGWSSSTYVAPWPCLRSPPSAWSIEKIARYFYLLVRSAKCNFNSIKLAKCLQIAGVYAW